jgi:hypothetical protein
MLYTYMLVVIADERDRTRSQNVQRNVNDDWVPLDNNLTCHEQASTRRPAIHVSIKIMVALIDDSTHFSAMMSMQYARRE